MHDLTAHVPLSRVQDSNLYILRFPSESEPVFVNWYRISRPMTTSQNYACRLQEPAQPATDVGSPNSP